MLKDANTFSGFSIDDTKAAKEFYNDKLGLDVHEDRMGLNFTTASGANIFLYQKTDHKPAEYTVLNFVVKDINSTVDGLMEAGVKFEHYDKLPAPQDDHEILRGLSVNQGPDIAWFKDPAGNILSVLQDKAH